MSGRRPSVVICWVSRRGAHCTARVYSQANFELELLRLWHRRIEAHAYMLDEFGSWEHDEKGNRIEVGSVWKDDCRADDGSYWRWFIDTAAFAEAEGVRG